ncbi:MAG: glycine cleavage system aminomethyltransferase GcvT, partial [Lentisphaerae bacterium]|nr:glycine cleavage system aminomethyltransferase GcvT [Lentisphaerota bacterium]
SSASLFDICHMGEFIIRGKSAEAVVDRLLTCRIDNLKTGICRYAYMLSENGTFIDDLLIYKMSDTEFMLVVNAARIEADATWIKSHILPGSEFIDISNKTAKLDIQGPETANILSPLLKIGLDTIRFFGFVHAELFGHKVLMSRTGYTGELGYEIYSSNDAVREIWDMLLEDERLKPAGLGCRDTLRLEMGFSLFGSDISIDTTPVDAGLMARVFMEKDFIGKPALLNADKIDSPEKRLGGIRLDGRQAARQGSLILVEDTPVGSITSGSFAPSLGCAIALGYMPAKIAEPGNAVKIQSGNKILTGVTETPPFYKEATGRIKL